MQNVNDIINKSRRMKQSPAIINHPRADFYVTLPFFIDDWSSFEGILKESGIWKEKTDCSRQSLKNLANCYLGEEDAMDFPIQKGMAFIGYIQKSKNTAFSSFTGEIAFRSAKGQMLFPIGGGYRTFWPDFEIEMHVAPSRHGGVALFHLATGDCPLQEAVNINYTIQKCDEALMPQICSFRDGVWTPMEGRKNLKELIYGLLPGGIAPVNDTRFHMISSVGVDTSSGLKPTVIESALVRLGMVKDWKYKIVDVVQNKILKPYDNIWTMVSHEGFSVVYLTPDMKKEVFLKDFFGRFPKSYMPIYLIGILAEQSFLGALRDLDYVAEHSGELDRLRETHLTLNFEPSHYSHLNDLMTSVTDVLNLEKKYEIILASISARRTQIETQRLKIEQENQKMALQRMAEEEKQRIELERRNKEVQKAKEKRDKTINFLLGFMGVGQVVFAILQLVGAEQVAGWYFARSKALIWVSWATIVIFTVLIIYIIVGLLRKSRNKSE